MPPSEDEVLGALEDDPPPRIPPSRSPSPPDDCGSGAATGSGAAVFWPRNWFAMNAMMIGTTIGSSFAMRSFVTSLLGFESATAAATSGVRSPNTFFTIFPPSTVSMLSILILPVGSGLACCPRAFSSDFAPVSVCEFAASPPMTVGMICSTAASATDSGIPNCFAMSPTGMRSSRPSNPAMRGSFRVRGAPSAPARDSLVIRRRPWSFATMIE